MKCESCNEKLTGSEKFCGFCGAKVVGKEVKASKKTETSTNNAEVTNLQYFFSRWRTLFSVFGNGFKAGILVALGTFVVWFVIEIIASFFGYCITARGQECVGGFGDLFILPIGFAIFTVVSSVWRSGEHLIKQMQEHEDIAMYFGLSNKIKEDYLRQKSLLTLFLERIYFSILVLIILFFNTSSLSSLVMWFVFIVLATDLKTYQKLGKLSDYLNTKIGGKKKSEPMSVGGYLKQFVFIGAIICGVLFLVVVLSAIFS